MNRLEFMRKLAELLEDIPAQERAEALRFYNGYFYDAGEENEQQVIESLGSPEAVAEVIRREVAEDMELAGSAGGDFSKGSRAESSRDTVSKQDERERGSGEAASDREVSGTSPWEAVSDPDLSGSGGRFQESRGQEETRQAGNAYRAPDYRAYRRKRREERRAYESYEEYGRDSEFQKPEWEGGRGDRTSNPWKVIAIIGLCILFSPVLIGLAAVIFGLVVTVFALLFGLMVTAAAMTVGCLVAGIVGLAAAISHIAWSPLWALLEIGVSLFSIGFGLFALWLCWLLAAKAGPGIWRGVKNLWRAVFRGRARV